MPSYDTLQELNASDVKTFDDDAKKLLAMMAMTKWRGYLSSASHAIMHAPDRKTTIVVSRDSLRGRSGNNAKAEYRRWLKAQIPPLQKKVDEWDALEKSPFGNLLDAQAPAGMEPGSWAWRGGAPVGLHKDQALEMKRSEAVCEWMNSRTGEQIKAEGALIYADEQPRSWSLFDTRGWPSLVDHGSTTTPEEAYARFLRLAPDAFPGQAAPPAPDEEITDVAKMYACPDCGKTWDNKRAVDAHRLAAHTQKSWTCEDCGRVFHSAGTHVLHVATHNKVACEVCGHMVVPHFLPRHMDKHGNERAKAVAKEVAVSPDATLTSPPDTVAKEVVVSPDVRVTSEGDSAILHQVRLMVSEPLVTQNLALRARVTELEAENERLVTEREDAKARMQLILEAAQA